MKPADPRAKRMREALDLLLANLEDELVRVRARVTALVASLSADAQVLAERCKCDGADAVETVMVEMRVRELAAARRELADKRERVREIQGVIEFAERAAAREKRV